MTNRPNILWLMPDEWRHDCLGAAGNPILQTPHLDILARRGALIRGAHCDAPICQPSRASLMTGKSVTGHGLRDNELSPLVNGQRFPSAETGTFAQKLQQAGYRTAAVGKINVTFPEWELAKQRRAQDSPALSREEFQQLCGTLELGEFTGNVPAYGFDTIEEEADKQTLLLFNSGYTRHLESLGLLESWRSKVDRDSGEYLRKLLNGTDAPMYADMQAMLAPEPIGAEHTLDAYLADRAADVIRTHDQSAPLFLWTCFVGPHPPFDAPVDAPVRYGALSSDLRIPPSEQSPSGAWGEFVTWARRRSGAEEIPADAFAEITAQYYAGCSLIDAGIGRIIDALRDTGMLNNTWIIFGSDHGEMLGDHGLLQKRVFYRSAVEVPLLVIPPTQEEETGKQEAEASIPRGEYGILCQNRDISATILDLGLGEQEFEESRSLLPVLRGQVAPREQVISDMAAFQMTNDGHTKVVRLNETDEILVSWDLDNDPTERLPHYQTHE